MIELSEHHLNIPRAVARKHARAAREQGLDEDDLVGIGNLALVEAANAFDPTRGHDGEDGIGPYLAQRVAWAIQNTVWPYKTGHRGRHDLRMRTASLDAPIGNDGDTVAALVGQRDASLSAVENADEAERWLSRLPARERAALLLVERDGLSDAEVAARLGLTRSSFCTSVLPRARRRLLCCRAACEGHERSGYRPGAPHLLAAYREAGGTQPQRLRALRRAMSQYVTARRAVGGVIEQGWYLVDHARQRAYGDYPGVKAALAAVDVVMDGRAPSGRRAWYSACVGWPTLDATSAEILVTLLSGPAHAAALASLTGQSEALTRTSAPLLVRLGLVTRAKGVGNVMARNVYTITPRALSCRQKTTPFVPIKGKKLLALKAAGYDVLPPHLVDEEGKP